MRTIMRRENDKAYNFMPSAPRFQLLLDCVIDVVPGAFHHPNDHINTIFQALPYCTAAAQVEIFEFDPIPEDVYSISDRTGAGDLIAKILKSLPENERQLVLDDVTALMTSNNIRKDMASEIIL